MELLFIIAIGTAMTLLAWAILLPFSEFDAAVRAARVLVCAVWDGSLGFFGRLALSDSVNAGRRGRPPRLVHQDPHVRHLLVAACTDGRPRKPPRRAGFAA